MTSFLALRLARLVLTLVFVSGLIFWLQPLAPADPAALFSLTDRAPTAEQIRDQFKLDPPLPTYTAWINRVRHGEFGQSVNFAKPVAELLRERYQASLQLMLMAVGLAFALSSALAQTARTPAAARRLADATAVGVLSVPSFVLGLAVVWLVWRLGGPLPYDRYAPLLQDWQRNLSATVLPALVLSVALVPALLRHQLRHVLGAPRWQGAIVAATQGAVAVMAMLSGLMVVEKIFAIPGLGLLLLESVLNRDFAVVSAVMLIAASAGAFAVFIADVAGALVDRRTASDVAPEPLSAADPAPRSRAGMLGVGLAMLGILVLLAGFAAWVFHDSSMLEISRPLQAPGRANLLGTDMFGRDVLGQLLFGVRPALVAGLIPAAAALVVGALIGMVAGGLVRFGGIIGRIVDALIGSFADAMLALPMLALAIAVASVLAASTMPAMAVIAIALTPVVVRTVRDRIVAGGAAGVNESVTAVIVVGAMLSIAAAILGFAAVSAFGFGAPPPEVSFGAMIGTAPHDVIETPWVAVPAGLVLLLAALAFNLIGLGLRDTFSGTPRERVRPLVAGRAET